MKLFLAASLRPQFLAQVHISDYARMKARNLLFTFFYPEEHAGYAQFLPFLKEKGTEDEFTFMLDSGAFSLFMKAQKEGKKLEEFVASPEFDQYLLDYVEYIKLCGPRIYTPVTLDIGFNPEMTYKIFKRIASLGIDHSWITPVIHNGTDPEWALRYIDEGSRFLGFGGIAAKGLAHPKLYRPWIEMLFNTLDKHNLIGKVNVHGFGMTVHEFLLAFPWTTVDSSKWLMIAGRGAIMLPAFNGTTPDYRPNHRSLLIANNSPKRRDAWQHYYSLSPVHQQKIREYIESRGFTVEELAQPKPYKRFLWNLNYYADLEIYINSKMLGGLAVKKGLEVTDMGVG